MEGILRWHHPKRGRHRGRRAQAAGRAGRPDPASDQIPAGVGGSTAASQWRRQGIDLGVAVDLTAADVLDARLPYDLAKTGQQARRAAGVGHPGDPRGCAAHQRAADLQRARPVPPLRHADGARPLRPVGRLAQPAALHPRSTSSSSTRPSSSRCSTARRTRRWCARPSSWPGRWASPPSSTASTPPRCTTPSPATGCTGAQGPALGEPMSVDVLRQWVEPLASRPAQPIPRATAADDCLPAPSPKRTPPPPVRSRGRSFDHRARLSGGGWGCRPGCRSPRWASSC